MSTVNSPNNPHPLDCLWLSLLSTCSWCVASASTWLALWLSLLSTCSWCVASASTWLALWLSLLSTCSWCVASASTWLALWLSLLSTCSWCVASASTWLALWLSLLSTCSWCVVSASTWLALWLSLLSTCSWCVVSALAPLYRGSRRIIQVDTAHWWWLRRDPPHDCKALWVYSIGLKLNSWRATALPNQTHLIQLIKLFRITRNIQAGVICSWLELNSADLWPSRNWVWEHWFTAIHNKALYKYIHPTDQQFGYQHSSKYIQCSVYSI